MTVDAIVCRGLGGIVGVVVALNVMAAGIHIARWA
jgi:hypothetical protein